MHTTGITLCVQVPLCIMERREEVEATTGSLDVRESAGVWCVVLVHVSLCSCVHVCVKEPLAGNRSSSNY